MTSNERPDREEAPIPLLDVSTLPLDVVLRGESTALSNALRRVYSGVNEPDESYAAHASTPWLPTTS